MAVRVKFVLFAAFVSYMLVSYDGYGAKFVYEMCVGSWPIGRCGCDAMARAAIVPPFPLFPGFAWGCGGDSALKQVLWLVTEYCGPLAPTS